MQKSTTLMSLALLLTGSVSFVFGEKPIWEDFERQVLVVRGHIDWGWDGPHPYKGLWLFDPSANTWQRARPLDVADDELYGALGVSLATWEDSVFVQRFPTSFEFELPTLRLVRTSTTMPLDTAYGWVLHGPAVDPQEAPSVGVPAGHYGFLQCTFTAIPYAENMGECADLGVPSIDEGTLEEQASLLVYKEHDASSRDFEIVAELSEYGGRLEWPYPLIVSPDPRHGGLWRGRRRSMQFMRRNASGQLEIEFERTVPAELFTSEHTRLFAAHYHPWSDTLLAVTTHQDWRFAALDPGTLSMSRLYDSCDECQGIEHHRFPMWMASLGSTPPPVKLQTVPIVVEAPGRNGTWWRTRLWLYNPSGGPVQVELSRVSAPDRTESIELPPHGSRVIDEPLQRLGGGAEGDGSTHDAVQVRSEYRFGENVVAAARVWTGGTAGTYGQAVPAVPDAVGYSNHRAISDHQFRYEGYVILDRREPGRYRHNLGIVNPSDEPLEVALQWVYHYPAHSELTPYLPEATRQRIQVAPHSVRMVHLEELFPAEVVEGWPPQVSVQASEQAIVWLSMVDNTTGDATFLPYTLRWVSWPEWEECAIPAVAHAQGVGGVLWRTDLYGHTMSFDPDDPWVLFHPGTDDVCGGLGRGDEIAQWLRGEMPMPEATWVDTLVANDLGRQNNPSRFFRGVFSDVVRLFFECENESNVRGALELASSTWMSAYSRTYVERADGGTYGGMLPMYPHSGWPVQHFAGIEVANDFRINLGLYNGDGEHPITHRLTLHASDGSVAAESEVTVAPWESTIRPLKRWLGIEELPEGTYGLTVLPLDDASAGVEGRCWAFVSMIDNRTGDPTNWW